MGFRLDACLSSLTSAAGALLLAGAALYACKSDETAETPPQNDTGSEAALDAPEDTNIGTVGDCIKSPTQAPFPSGACNSPKPAAADSFDEALGMIKLDRCKFGQDPKLVPNSAWDLNDKRRLPDFEPILTAPLRLPAYGAETSKWLDDAVASDHPISNALVALAVRRGAPVTSCPDPAWFVIDKDDTAPLATAIIASAEKAGAPVDPDATKAAVATLPLDLQRALSPIVRAIADSNAAVVAARGAPTTKLLNLLNAVPSWIVGTRQIAPADDFQTALDAVDVAKMTEAAAQVASVIESAKLSRFVDLDVPNVEIDTPFGAIVVHGKGKDTYMPGSLAENAAFLLDTGGDDTYRVPVGAGTLKLAFSAAVDLGGKDFYGYVEKKVAADDQGTRLPSDGSGRGPVTLSRIPRQGGGLLGVGMLFDYGKGDDTYRSLAVSQGTGILGVGALFDEGGNDDYASETLSQGAAGFGIGVLLDKAGSDKYSGYNAMQGFGYTRGVGAIVDLAGDDKYFVNPGSDTRFDPALKGDSLYPSAQLPDKGNTSMSQGCGQGRRWDSNPVGYQSPEYQFIGGMGILRDAAGNDSYIGSVFTQGCGFLGFGMFLEGGGDDTYEGMWYVQGATAHMGIAFFHDHAGNDKYNPTFPIAATSIGVGHDFSVSVHLDEGGDDAYNAPGLSLGSGYANGLGLLVNVGGVDVFKAGGDPTLGGACACEVFTVGGRGKMPTVGTFVKAGGTAKYFVGGTEKTDHPGGSWSYAPEATGDGGVDAARSVGIDRPSGTAVLP